MANNEDARATQESFEPSVDLSALDPRLVSQAFDDLNPGFEDPLAKDPLLPDRRPRSPSNAASSSSSLILQEGSRPSQSQQTTANRSSDKLPRAPSPTPSPEPTANPRKKTPSTEPTGQLKRVNWTRDMTDQVMLWFNDCKNRGLFDSSKRRDYSPVWNEVMERCRELWPQFPWSTKVIAVKYDTEKKRFQLWKMLVDGYSGVSFNHATGLPEVSKETWEQFVKRNNTKSRSVIWLKNTPLGDVDIYRSVFFREKASGAYIAEAGDAEAGNTEGKDTGDAGDDSGRDNPDLLDDESDDDDVVVATPAPKERRLTAAQKRRLENDPDHTPADTDTPSSIAVPPSAAKKRVRERDSTILANSLRDSMALLATSTPRPEGADDIEKAVEDILKLFAKDISEDELMRCIDHIQKNPVHAVTWHKLTISLKKRYIMRWSGRDEEDA